MGHVGVASVFVRSAHDRAEALERSLSEHRQEADAKGVFVKEAAEKELRVEADKDRMAQVVVELTAEQIKPFPSHKTIKTCFVS